MNTPETKYYIGIDGGGTKTKFLLGRLIEGYGEDGAETSGLEVVGEYTAGGCHYMQKASKPSAKMQASKQKR